MYYYWFLRSEDSVFVEIDLEVVVVEVVEEVAGEGEVVRVMDVV